MKSLRAWLRAGLAGLLLIAPTGKPVGAAEQPGVPESYVIVITGGELLRGVYPDGHTWFLTRALRPLGLQCVGSVCVGDEAPDLMRALEFACSRASLVIVTGGLGPTDDDITRQALSSFTGIPLAENADVMGALARRFGGGRTALRANLRRQALTPEAGKWLPNPNGTAVGLVFDDDTRFIVALPGPPRELQPMVRHELIPLLQQRFGLRVFGSSTTLRFVGIGESLIDQTLHDDVRLPPDLVISSIFEAGRVDVTFSLPGGVVADQERLSRLIHEVKERLGDRIYAADDQTLEDVVLTQLSKAGRRLLLAEIGTGGAVGVSLNRSSRAGAVVAGGWVAPARQLLLGMTAAAPQSDDSPDHEGFAALSATTPEAFLRQAALAIAGRLPGGVALVDDAAMAPASADGARRIWVAFGPWQGEVRTRQFAWRGTGSEAQALLVTNLLDWMRGVLQEPPVADASERVGGSPGSPQ